MRKMKVSQSAFPHPQSLVFVRHGESTANIARHTAEAKNLLTIDFPEREIDVPLSEFGKNQSAALGNWFKLQKEKPSVVVSSPYLRATETARIICETAGFVNTEIFLDERIRERELGIFDRLTKLGAMGKFPDECAKRELLGKFYHRPPSGESWADVALRVRSFWCDVRKYHAGERVLIVTHEVVIRIFRYILENLTEAEILAIDSACDVENCAVTSYYFDAGGNKMVLKSDNHLP